jgi:hypothetical protein
MDNRQDNNFIPLLVHLVDDDVRPFEKFAGSIDQAGTAMLVSSGTSSRITLASMRAIISIAARGLSLAIHANMRSSSALAAGSNVTLMYATSGTA